MSQGVTGCQIVIKTSESVRLLQSITAVYPVSGENTEPNLLIMGAISRRLITPILDTLPDSQKYLI